MWDGGSNRVLIDNQFAEEQGLRSQEISYRLAVVGGKDTIEKGLLHEVELVDNNGQVENVWGFGIDCIMEPSDPVDLTPVSSLFPHIPDNMFKPLG